MYNIIMTTDKSGYHEYTEAVRNLLSSSRYATISTVDGDGKPWAAPVWYAFSKSNASLYWWSPISAQHSKNIDQSNDCYITIFDSTAPEGEGFGVYIRAIAKQVPERKIDEIIELYNNSTKLFKLNHSNTTGAAPTRLYQAEPISIQVNDSLEINGFYTDIRRDIG